MTLSVWKTDVNTRDRGLAELIAMVQQLPVTHLKNKSLLPPHSFNAKGENKLPVPAALFQLFNFFTLDIIMTLQRI